MQWGALLRWSETLRVPLQRVRHIRQSVRVATVTHLDGSMEEATSEMVAIVLDELARADEEHPDVAISDEFGWGLSAFSSGRVVWENVEEGTDPVHMTGVSRTEMARLFRLVLEGDLTSINAEPWEPGY